MSWWNVANRGQQAVDAENEYLNSITEKANATKEYGDNISPENIMNDSQQIKEEIANNAEYNNANEQNTENTVTKSGAVNNVVQAEKRTNANKQRINQFAKAFSEKQKYDEYQTINNAKNLASEEAKMKYELAVQKHNQLRTAILNSLKILGEFGVFVKDNQDTSTTAREDSLYGGNDE